MLSVNSRSSLFFFSSRRRHTRLQGDWSSDVCSSDLGDDTLIGGSGRDVLIGGVGADRLVAGGGDDLLIAGRTIYDDDPQALRTILQQWASGDSYEQRVARLTSGVGGIRLSDATVLDDGATDTLTGGSGRDWFLAAVGRNGDNVTDRQSTEILTALRRVASPPDSRGKPVIDWDSRDSDNDQVSKALAGGWLKDSVLDFHDPTREFQIVLKR